jgi:hypothetical protein
MVEEYGRKEGWEGERKTRGGKQKESEGNMKREMERETPSTL